MSQERRNDRFKLAHHRLVARTLRRNPGLLEEARAVVRDWKREPRHAAFVEQWDELLSRPLDAVCREIVRRTPEADRLRISSPFALTPLQVISGDQAKRLRRMASRAPSAW